MPITEQQRAAAQRRLDRAREAGDAAAEQRETSFLGQGTEPTAPAVPETTPQAGAPDQGLAIDQPGARERTEPGRPLRRDFDPGEQGQVEFTQSLNQFLGRDTTPPAEPTAGPERDLQAEAETAQRLGGTPDPNNIQEVVDFAQATYGQNLPAEFESLRQQLESLRGGGLEGQAALGALGGDISQFGQEALGAQGQAQAEGAQIQPQLNTLQEALKAKSGVGRETLGEADVFKQAGVEGIGALSQSLNARSAEIDFRFNSFSNTVKSIADSQFASNAADLQRAETALDQYSLLQEEYQFEQGRMDQISQREEDFSRELQLMSAKSQMDLQQYEEQYKLDQKYSKRSWGSDLGGFVDDFGNIIYPQGTSTAVWQGGEPVDTTDSDPLASKVVQGQELRTNCVLYAREFVPNLPHGLWNISDKAAAIEMAGFRLGDGSGQVPSIGDAVLTSEGEWGHALVIAGFDGDNMIIKEANYRAGRVTEGRMLSIDSDKVLGFVSSTTGPQATLVVNFSPTASENEGMNPEGAEEFTGTFVDPQTLSVQASGLLQGFGGTGDERQNFADQMTALVLSGRAETLLDAKKIIGIKTEDDKEFIDAAKVEAKVLKKDFQAASTKLDLLPELVALESGPGDVSTFFTFLKVLDPGSVARESEVEAVANATSFIGKLENKAGQVKTGKLVNDEQRQQYIDAFNVIKEAQSAKLYEQTLGFQRDFEERGLEFTISTQTFIDSLKSNLSPERAAEIESQFDVQADPGTSQLSNPEVDDWLSTSGYPTVTSN